MNRRGDIIDGERLDEIEIEVIEATHHNSSSVAGVLTVEDTAGLEFQVKLWHTHDVDVPWQEGWRYVLKQGLGKRRSNGTIALSSTHDFTVSAPDGVVNLLAIGDSHIGREARPKDANPPYHSVRQFVSAMGYAVQYNVDAVLHAGDCFDDDPTRMDFEMAKCGLRLLGRENIPFYYIYGNHGVPFARELYDRVEDVDVHHLGTTGVELGDTVALCGVDYASPGELRDCLSELSDPSDVARRVILFHNEIDPPRTAGGVPAGVVFDSLESERDHVLSGHLHEPESTEYSGSTIQYLGSTADISAVNSAEDQSAWVIQVAPTNVALTRIELR